MWNAGLGESQAGIKIAKTNINNLRYADDTTLMVEVKELKSLLMKVKITLMVEVKELKSFLMKVKTTLMVEVKELKSLLMKVRKKSEKAGLKFSIQKTKIMASVRITLWQIEGEEVEAVTDFIFLGSRITADGDRSHEIKTLAP